MSGLERRCRLLLLRAYPAWYRRERSGEILDTLLQATPPGRRWPAFREGRALVWRGLRARGWPWLLLLLWVALGAGGAVYAFVLFSRGYEEFFRDVPQWPSEPLLLVYASMAGVVVWALLAGGVLVGGVLQFDVWRPSGVRLAGWVVAWLAGLALFCLTVAFLYAGREEKHSRPNDGELVICAAWLLLGAVMAVVLGWPGPAGRRAGAGGRVGAGPA